MTYVVGQRWLSHADAQLGLGIVTEEDARRVTVFFPAVEEHRTYATNNAPLSRIAYRVGETIRTRDERELTVTEVNELRGLLIYTAVDAEGAEQLVTEQQLSAQVQLTAPQQRLGGGQCDSSAAFALRVATLEQRSRLQQAPAAGLLGARTSLLPHQLYIAAEVAHRHAPRVLLADEVGLGKTIEAGLIIHQQLHTGRAQRVLMVVPEPLLHQWLVEMLRRFNLPVALFDAERLAALAAAGEDDDAEHEVPGNPFESEQLVLCSLELLLAQPDALTQAVAAEWDLLVVDEAHHLHWSPTAPGPEYLCVEQLAARSAGLILLTATPEQAGIDSHFARLRLLDPARFHDLAAFKAEAAGYGALNALVQQLLQQSDGRVGDALLPALRDYCSGDELSADTTVDEAIRLLLDRHGTGRVLFRNTRAAVAGFPERHLHTYPLPLPELYAQTAENLYPERSFDAAEWLKADPRVAWLEQLLKQLRPAKVLVICAHAATAVALEQHLHLRAGIRSAAFHEGLSIIERDRAAAWFAEQELGAQALVCSEIGSEGRNFQFAQHLVLFDLPLNPDLLEQRIGRLDRIGQGPRIDLHVPYLEHSAQAVLLRWYDDGLDLFRRSFAAGYALFERFEKPLRQQLQRADAGLDALVRDTATVAGETRIALQEGRDALLELNSCRPAEAAALIESIRHEETSDQLQAYMQQLWDYFGLDCETHSEHAVVVRPSDHMLVSHFPGLPDDGLTVCFDRAQALAREDMAFFTWEHPMVQAAMEMIIGAEHGNACVATINIKGLQPGTLLLEAVFSVHSPAPKRLQVERFLPLSPLRVLVDRSGKNLAEILPHARLNGLCGAVPKQTAPAILKQLGDDIELLLGHARRLAETQLPPLVAAARAALGESLDAEIRRLRALAQVNPAIRTEEITFFEQQLAAGDTVIARAELELQALRLVINT